VSLSVGEVIIPISGTSVPTDDKFFTLGSSGVVSSKYNGSMNNVAVYEFFLQFEVVHDLCEVDAGLGLSP